VQVNGRLRDKIIVPRGTPQTDIENAALSSPRIQSFTAGKTIRKVILVPNKLVNVVTG